MARKTISRTEGTQQLLERLVDDRGLLIQDLILSPVRGDAEQIADQGTDLETVWTQRYGYRVPFEQYHGRDGFELRFLNDLIVFEAKRIFSES